jgi:hypothetical protein
MGLFRAFQPNRRPIPVRGCIARVDLRIPESANCLRTRVEWVFGIVLACL